MSNVLNKLLSKIPRQKKVGTFLGGLKELLGRTIFYVSIINFLLLMVTAYYTTLRNFIPIPFWTFFLILIAIVIVALILEYTIILPSSIAFMNIQAYKHENPLRDDVQEILRRMEKIEEDIKKIKESIRK
jgi:small-conductance mechanosensitive channel